LGRFIIWSRGAFDKLNSIYGTTKTQSRVKNGYFLPRNIMSNSDITRLINSDEVQSKLRPSIKGIRRTTLRKNPLVNLGAMVKLNPFAVRQRRSAVLAEKRRAVNKAAYLAAVRAKKPRPELPGSRKAKALERTHQPQQRENYRRLIQGEAYVPPRDKDGEPLKVTKWQKAKAPVASNSLKKSEKKKVKKKVAKKEEKKEEKKTAIVVPAGPLKLLKAPKEVRVKKAAKAKKEGGKAKKEAGKEEGKGAGKAEAGKAEGKKEAAKGEAAKKGGKK